MKQLYKSQIFYRNTIPSSLSTAQKKGNGGRLIGEENTLAIIDQAKSATTGGTTLSIYQAEAIHGRKTYPTL